MAQLRRMSDEFKQTWETELERETLKEEEKAASMKKSRLCDFIADPHQKIYYVFDFSAMKNVVR